MPSIEESVIELQAILDHLTTEATAIAGASETLDRPRNQTQGATEATTGLTAEAETIMTNLEELAEVTIALSYTQTAEHVTAARETVAQARSELETIGSALGEQAAKLQTVSEDLTEIASHLQGSKDAIELAVQQLRALTDSSRSTSGAPAPSKIASQATSAAPREAFGGTNPPTAGHKIRKDRREPGHIARVKVTDRNGAPVYDYRIESGNQTESERKLGRWKGALASHTENRAARMHGSNHPDILDDPFFGTHPIERGWSVEIEGTREPCPSCRNAMSRLKRDTGAQIAYIWGDNRWPPT